MGTLHDFPGERMPCSATVAELQRDEIGLGPDDYDPRWEAYETCRDDAAVMQEELGEEEFQDFWTELHSVIQAPLEKGVSPEVAKAAKLAHIECCFERWLDRAATLRAANREWLERDPWRQE